MKDSAISTGVHVMIVSFAVVVLTSCMPAQIQIPASSSTSRSAPAPAESISPSPANPPASPTPTPVTIPVPATWNVDDLFFVCNEFFVDYSAETGVDPSTFTIDPSQTDVDDGGATYPGALIVRLHGISHNELAGDAPGVFGCVVEGEPDDYTVTYDDHV